MLGSVSALLCRLPFLLLIVMAAGCAATIPPLPSAQKGGYQSVLEWTHEVGMPGAVLLVRTPKSAFLGSVGVADIEKNIPMRPDHTFRIGSITKTFLGVVAAQMQAEGILDIEESLTTYLPPEITRHTPNSDRITVHQMLRHQSGIYNFDQSWAYGTDRWFLHRETPWPAERMLEYGFDEPADFPPGQGYGYSNANFILTGLILDSIAGHHHSQEIRRRILEPLEMHSTYYESFEEPRGELAHGYQNLLLGREDTIDWAPVVGGGAGMVSTVSDLAVFVRAISGSPDFPDPATQKVVRGGGSASDDARKTPNGIWNYDFGIDSTRRSPELPRFYGHHGIQPGYLSLAWHDPIHDITVVYYGTSAHLRMIDSMKIAKAIYAGVEQLVFEIATLETRGSLLADANQYRPRGGSELQGEWRGTVGAPLWPFSRTRMKLRVAEDTSGQLRGELDDESQAKHCQPLSGRHAPRKVEFALESGAGSFRGALNEEGTQMVGEWSTPTKTQPATFTRSPGFFAPDHAVVQASRSN